MNLLFPYQSRQFPNFSAADWLKVVFAGCVIAMLALGTHDIAIAHLGIPYPDESSVPASAKFVGQFFRIAAAVYLCHLSRWYLDKQGAFAAAVLVGTIFVFFHETLRVIIIENVLVEGWVDHRWIYMGAKRLSSACTTFFWGAAAAMIARRFAGKSVFLITAVVLATTVVGYVVIRPGIAETSNLLIHALRLTEPTQLYKMPYSKSIYTVIYGTFIEPTIAMFLITWLAWPGLKGSAARRTVMLAAITLVMRGRIIATFFFCFWIKQPLGLAMAAEGQFFVETLILATLTGCAWCLLINKRDVV